MATATATARTRRVVDRGHFAVGRRVDLRDSLDRLHAAGPILGRTYHQGAGYYTLAGNQVREAVNTWITTRGAFDAVLDFDAALQDPADPADLLPAYDSGDHLHPNNAGYQAAVNAISPQMLEGGASSPG